MTLCIMILNMSKLGRLSERRDIPIQISQPLMEVWIVGANGAEVGLEVLNVYDVEADYCCVETDICFCYRRAVVEGAFLLGFLEVFLCAIQTFE